MLAEPIDRTVAFRSAMAGLFDQEGRLVAQSTVESGPAAGGFGTAIEYREGAGHVVLPREGQ